jgi:hypothetical protein
VFTSRKEAACLIEALKIRHAPHRVHVVQRRRHEADESRQQNHARCSRPPHRAGYRVRSNPRQHPRAAQYEGEAREALDFGWHNQNPSASLCNIEKNRQNALQCGYEGPVVPSSGVVDLPGGCGGWWSSVIAEARYDVGDWCA